MVVAGVVLGQMNPAYLAVLAVLPVSLWLVGSLRAFVNNKDVAIEPKPWMGPMGDWDNYVKAGIDWFLFRWLLARNICTFFCLVLMIIHIVLLF